VSLADRILVFGANPGHIRVELKGLPQSDRSEKSAPRARLVELIYRIMTNPEDDALAIVEQRLQGRTREPVARGSARMTGARAQRYQVLPDVSIDDLTGLVQYLGGIGGHAAVQDLARDLQMRADDLLAIVEATDLLGFGALHERQVALTPIGARFADAELDEEKAIFRSQALDHIALLHHIVRDLETAPTHTLDAERVIDELEHSFSGEEARRQFETAVDWGRYAELFTYDDSSGELTLDEEHRLRRG
jgi:NitT/TauT family transport system ATP-binding protein